MIIQRLEIKRRDSFGKVVLDARVEALDEDGHEVSWESSWQSDDDFTESKLPEVIMPLVEHLIGPEPVGQKIIMGDITYKRPLERFKVV